MKSSPKKRSDTFRSFVFSIHGGRGHRRACRSIKTPLYPAWGRRYSGAPLPGLRFLFSFFQKRKRREERRRKKDGPACTHARTLCERVPWHDRTHQRAAFIQAQSQHQARAAACRIASSFCARVRPPAECRRAACPHALQDGAGCAVHVRLIVSSSEAQSPSQGKLEAKSVYTIT